MRSSNSARLIDLPIREDLRGKLCFAQTPDHMPFTPVRIFVIYDVSPGAERGGHAHKECHQALMAVGGQVDLTVWDGGARGQWSLHAPNQLLHVPPGQWLNLTRFSNGASLVVLASHIFDEADYLRDESEFLRFLGL